MDAAGTKASGTTTLILSFCFPGNANKNFVYNPSTKMPRSPFKSNLCLDDNGATVPGGTCPRATRATRTCSWTCVGVLLNDVFLLGQNQLVLGRQRQRPRPECQDHSQFAQPQQLQPVVSVHDLQTLECSEHDYRRHEHICAGARPRILVGGGHATRRQTHTSRSSRTRHRCAICPC